MIDFSQPSKTIFERNSSQLEHRWFLEGCCAHDSLSTKTILHSDSFNLGRSLECDMTLMSHDISKFHAQIIGTGEVVILKDLGSTNGTYVNGCRISEPTPVGVGDLLQFATLEFRLGRIESAPEYQTREVESLESGWMLSQMHQILNLKQFWMVYQPIIVAEDLRRYGVEALIRCDIPGLKSPLQLFQTAVQLGLEKQLSTAARDKAAKDLSAYPPLGRLFVNIHSNEHLGPELVESLKEINQILGDWKLVVEVHEAAMPDLQMVTEFKQTLHALGIELAYDDFGAGQSRLRELIEVPPDYVKFDRAIVSGLSNGSSRQISIIESLVQFCRDSQIHTIAEGIENEEDGKICRELGFDFLQGYLYGRPMKQEIIFGEEK